VKEGSQQSQNESTYEKQEQEVQIEGKDSNKTGSQSYEKGTNSSSAAEQNKKFESSQESNEYNDSAKTEEY